MTVSGVRLTPEARDYVREKGGALTLRSTLRHGCCGGRVELLKAEAERPRSEDGFRRLPLDELTLHVEEGLLEELDGPIEVGLDRLLGLRSLYVSGSSSRM
jgi:hypothetical protein